MWYVMLQTKSTRSRGMSRGVPRATVWTTQRDDALLRRLKVSVEQWLSQRSNDDGGVAEVLTTFRTEKEMRAAMLKWWAALQKAAFPAPDGSRKANDFVIDLARKHFGRYGR